MATASRPKLRKPSASKPRLSIPQGSTPKASSAPALVADPVVDMLNRYGFEFELVTLPLSTIDRKASQLNQARIAKPIDEDQVLVYAAQKKDGDKFPPVVVYSVGTDRYIVMDGNHRVAADDIADFATVAAYVVKDPSPAQIQSFTFEANTKHGMPTSLQDRLRQGVFLIEQEVSPKDAARQLGIPPGTLASHWDAYQAEKRFRSLGIKKFEALTPTAKRKLDSIHSDVVLKAAAELVLEAVLHTEDIGALVRDVNAIRAGEREQLRYIASQREARQATIKATAGGRVPIPVGISNLLRITSTINNMDVPKLTTQLKRLPADVRIAHARAASDSVTKLMDIIRAVQQSG